MLILESMSFMVQALIQAQQLSKNYGATHVLSDISLRVMAGEIITIIGPNAAGKTTLLRCLMGMEPITSGTITRAENLRIGYVPQRLTPPTILPMNVRYFLSLHSEYDAETAHQLGVDAYLDMPLTALSGGQFQRVLLARALGNRPQLLVLDEPAQGMDLHAEVECYALIEKLRSLTQCAVLMVSHDLHIVMAASDRVLCIQHHICCEGTPQHVQNDPAFRAMFGDNLAEKLALYPHHHSHRHDDAGAVVALNPNPHEDCHHG